MIINEFSIKTGVENFFTDYAVFEIIKLTCIGFLR